MAVVAVPALKDHLGQKSALSEVRLEEYGAAAEVRIGQEVGPLEATGVTERVRPGVRGLALSYGPVLEVLAVSGVNAGAVALGDLYVDADAGVIEYDGAASFTDTAYDVTYIAGHSDPDATPDPIPCPANLVLAVKELVRVTWRPQRGDDDPIVMPDVLPPEVTVLLSGDVEPGFA